MHMRITERDPRRHRVKMASNDSASTFVSSNKRKYCDHCDDKVSRATYFRHQKARRVMGELEDNVCAAMESAEEYPAEPDNGPDLVDARVGGVDTEEDPSSNEGDV